MAILTTQQNRRFSDLDLNFNIHPIKKDINKNYDQTAVINSIKNLILTRHYERKFHPEIGSNTMKSLFENIDKITASNLEREIQQTIDNFEPRASVKKVVATPDYDNNGYTITMDFTIVNITNTITIKFFLQRVR